MNKLIYDWPFKIYMTNRVWDLIFANVVVSTPTDGDEITAIRFYDYNLQNVIDHIWEWHDKHMKYYWKDQEHMDFLKNWPLKQWLKFYRKNLTLW